MQVKHIPSLEMTQSLLSERRQCEFSGWVNNMKSAWCQSQMFDGCHTRQLHLDLRSERCFQFEGLC